MSADDAAAGQRIDQWLWHARRFPSRSAAGRFVEEGGVRVFRAGVSHRITKASFRIKAQDEIAYLHRGAVVALRIIGCATRRGPASEATKLFVVLSDASPVAKTACAAAPLR